MPSDATVFQSPVDRRWLRVIGGTVLLALMVLTAYSLLADYAGGDTEERTSIRGPVSGTSLTAPSIARLSEPSDFSGTITVSTPRAITLETQTGPRVVRIDDDTKVFVEDGTPGTRDDLTRDSAVAIVATTQDGRTYTATEIAILPR